MEVRYSFPDGVAGQNVTLATSGGEHFSVAGSNTMVFEDIPEKIGAAAVRGVATSAGGNAYWGQDVSGITGGRGVSADVYLIIHATPSTDLPQIWLGDGTTRAIEVQIRNSLRLRLANTGNTPWDSSGSLPLETVIRLACFCTPHASTATMKAAWFYGFESAPQESSGLITGRNVGVVSAIRHGAKARTTTCTGNVSILSYAWNDDATDYPTPLSEPPPPQIEPLFAGDKPARNLYAGDREVIRLYRGAVQMWPPGGRILSMRATGTAFAPKVELAAASDATITWESTGATIGGTQTEPTFTWADSGSHDILMTVDHPQDVLTLNFGFDHLQDEGRYNVGEAYNYTPQPLTSISGLPGLGGLKRFLAATSTLTGNLDFTGCTELEFIECYFASVGSVVLDGCDSLIRLCLESCAVTDLDLNPVRTTLRDLRAAVQSGAALGFATLDGPMAELYHYCIRGNLIINNVPLQLLPKIEQWWVWSTNIASSSVGVPTSTVLNSCQADNCGLDATAVNNIINGIYENVPGAFGAIDLIGNAAPTGIALTRAAEIDARAGWTCEVAV